MLLKKFIYAVSSCIESWRVIDDKVKLLDYTFLMLEFNNFSDKDFIVSNDVELIIKYLIKKSCKRKMTICLFYFFIILVVIVLIGLLYGSKLCLNKV